MGKCDQTRFDWVEDTRCSRTSHRFLGQTWFWYYNNKPHCNLAGLASTIKHANVSDTFCPVLGNDLVLQKCFIIPTHRNTLHRHHPGFASFPSLCRIPGAIAGPGTKQCFKAVGGSCRHGRDDKSDGPHLPFGNKHMVILCSTYEVLPKLRDLQNHLWESKWLRHLSWLLKAK